MASLPCFHASSPPSSAPRRQNMQRLEKLALLRLPKAYSITSLESAFLMDALLAVFKSYHWLLVLPSLPFSSPSSVQLQISIDQSVDFHLKSCPKSCSLPLFTFRTTFQARARSVFQTCLGYHQSVPIMSLPSYLQTFVLDIQAVKCSWFGIWGSYLALWWVVWRIWKFTVLPRLRPNEPRSLPYCIPR